MIREEHARVLREVDEGPVTYAQMDHDDEGRYRDWRDELAKSFARDYRAARRRLQQTHDFEMEEPWDVLEELEVWDDAIGYLAAEISDAFKSGRVNPCPLSAPQDVLRIIRDLDVPRFGNAQ